jgi:hypothetical protein
MKGDWFGLPQRRVGLGRRFSHRDRWLNGASTRGAVLVNLVLCGCAAYRTQLFLYLKACAREELNTMNRWAGVDSATA